MIFGNVRYLLLGIMMTGLLIACQASPTPEKPMLTSPKPTEIAVVAPTKVTQDQSDEISSPSPEIIDTPTLEPEPEEPIATSRPDLTATDPTSVKLASGKPSLVEFFAFW